MSRRIAILIASSRFPSEPTLSVLESPENDVRRLEEVLRDEQTGRFGDLHVLPNFPCQQVRLRLNQVLNQAAKEDLVLIYYSGHGKLDANGKLCLAMTDTQLTTLGASPLRLSDVLEFIGLSKCKRVALFLDCCYSGAIPALTKGDVDGELRNAAQGSGLCIMTASSATQPAFEAPQAGLGVFTQHLVDGLKTGEADKDEDGEISHDELFEFVSKRVTDETPQRPQMYARIDGRLVLAYSGNKRWIEERDILREHLLTLAADGTLGNKVVIDALSKILGAEDRHTFSETEKLRLDLLRRLQRGEVGLGEFRDKWDAPVAGAAAAAKAPPVVEVVPAPPPEKKPIVAIEAVLTANPAPSPEPRRAGL